MRVPPETARLMAERDAIGGLAGLISTTACPTCGTALQAFGEDPETYSECAAGHRFTVETLLDVWAKEKTPSIKKYLGVLEISEDWCRRMATRALNMGLSVVAANYHERAMIAEARAAQIRQAIGMRG